jgi:hypothetical protein
MSSPVSVSILNSCAASASEKTSVHIWLIRLKNIWGIVIEAASILRHEGTIMDIIHNKMTESRT